MNESSFCEKLRNPLVVFWELTRKCNLKCKHCYTHSKNDGIQLTKKELLYILDLLLDRKIFSLGLGGGEPLVVEELNHIVHKASQNDVDVTLSTNGLLVSQDKAKKLKDLGISVVQVSVDGTKETHELIRGKGSFEKAIKSIEMLKEAGIVTRLAFTANRINFMQLEEVFLLSQKIGADWFIVFRYMNSGRDGIGISLENEQLKKVTENLIRLQKRFPLKVFFEKLLFFPFLLDEEMISGKSCNAGKSIMNICANGDVTPCPHVQNYVVGNVFRHNFDKIWNNPKIEMEKEICSSCKSCAHVKNCKGGCKGTFMGNLSRDPLCWKRS